MRSGVKTLAVLAAGVGMAWGVGARGAVILTTADGQGADSFVSNDTQSGNYGNTSTHGSEGSAAVRHYDGTRAKAAYFRFDLSGVSGDLAGATLTFTFSGANRGRTMNVYGLTDQAGDTWSEADLAYDNAPGILQPADGGVAYDSAAVSVDPTKMSVVDTFTTPSSNGNTVTTATSTDLDNLLAADNNSLVTFMLFTASSDSSQSYFIATKENTAGSGLPTLTLPNATLAAAPEPVSLGLVGVGLGLMAVRRRRV